LIEDGNAEAFVPDNEGLFPLDYAGFFKHYEVVLYLIEHLVSRLENPIMK
jgi:ankyrin repeat protein